MNLYTLTSLQIAIQANLEAAGFDDKTIADTLEGEDNTDSLQQKRLGFIAIIKSKRALSEARAKAANDMLELAESEAKDAGRLEAALMASMTATGDKKIIGLQFQASVQNNPPSVEVYDPLSLPAIYMRYPVPKPPVAAPDKAMIKADLQAGLGVLGAKIVQSQRLVIR